MAIKHNILQHNPLDIVIHEKHERKHGKALTIDEEKLLLQKAKEPYKTLFAIALYTGIRPNEYETVQITDNMIYANNSKRHNGKVETKRIPIIPMLRPYINADTVMPNVSINSARKIIKKILGDERKLYDLRTTFYTRCQMYGVAPAARDEFVGHSSGELTDTYTDLPDDYLIKEGLKLDY
jgi:integrase